MSGETIPETGNEMNGARKTWVTPDVILSDMRATENNNSHFTDGTSSHGVAYGAS